MSLAGSQSTGVLKSYAMIWAVELYSQHNTLGKKAQPLSGVQFEDRLIVSSIEGLIEQL